MKIHYPRLQFLQPIILPCKGMEKKKTGKRKRKEKRKKVISATKKNKTKQNKSKDKKSDYNSDPPRSFYFKEAFLKPSKEVQKVT